MKIYENQHFYIYKYDNKEDLYIVCPKDKYPNFCLNKEDTQNLIKSCETK